MKKVLSLLVLLLSLQYVSAQGLKVMYEEISNPYLGRDISKNYENVDNPEVRAFLENQAKTPIVTNSELIANRGVSIYQRNKKLKETEESSLEGERFKATMTHRHQIATNTVMYISYIDSIIVSQIDLYGKIYLLESPVPNKKVTWTITSEQQNILGYNCVKATRIFGEAQKIGNIETHPHEIVAWYCPDIPVNAGPENYNGLPGLILKAEMDKGVRIYNAVSIEPLAPDTEIVKPENGEKVGAEEFIKILAESDAKQREKINRKGGNVITIQR